MLDKIFSFAFAGLILDFVKIVVWPTVIVIICCRFASEIKGLINRIISLEGPGGVKINTPPSQERATEIIPEEIKESIDLKEIEIKDKLTNKHEFQVKHDELLSQVASLQTALFFERTYYLIYGSQITLLEDLRSKGEIGDSYENIASYYQRMRLLWPNLNSYSLENYLGFLERSNLIEQPFNDKTKKYKITTYGIDFLEYIEGLNYYKGKLY